MWSTLISHPSLHWHSPTLEDMRPVSYNHSAAVLLTPTRSFLVLFGTGMHWRRIHYFSRLLMPSRTTSSLTYRVITSIFSSITFTHRNVACLRLSSPKKSHCQRKMKMKMKMWSKSCVHANTAVSSCGNRLILLDSEHRLYKYFINYTNYATVACDSLTYKMASATLTIESNSKWCRYRLMYTP